MVELIIIDFAGLLAVPRKTSVRFQDAGRGPGPASHPMGREWARHWATQWQCNGQCIGQCIGQCKGHCNGQCIGQRHGHCNGQVSMGGVGPQGCGRYALVHLAPLINMTDVSKFFRSMGCHSPLHCASSRVPVVLHTAQVGARYQTATLLQRQPSTACVVNARR